MPECWLLLQSWVSACRQQFLPPGCRVGNAWNVSHHPYNIPHCGPKRNVPPLIHETCELKKSVNCHRVGHWAACEKETKSQSKNSTSSTSLRSFNSFTILIYCSVCWLSKYFYFLTNQKNPKVEHYNQKKINLSLFLTIGIVVSSWYAEGWVMVIFEKSNWQNERNTV